jgi:hypothetical protein
MAPQVRADPLHVTLAICNATPAALNIIRNKPEGLGVYQSIHEIKEIAVLT